MTAPTLVVLDADSPLRRVQRIALVVGAIGLVATALGAVLDVEQALRSYLAGFVFWTAGRGARRSAGCSSRARAPCR
jgi:hypothetical protein